MISFFTLQKIPDILTLYSVQFLESCYGCLYDCDSLCEFPEELDNLQYPVYTELWGYQKKKKNVKKL